MANVREIARELSDRNIGAVLFAGSETGGDMLNTHGGSLEAVAQAIDTVLAAGKPPPWRGGTGCPHCESFPSCSAVVRVTRLNSPSPE